MEKFIKALDKVKAGGRWSLGLVIAESKAMDFGVFPPAEKILVDGVPVPDEVIKKISLAFSAGKWVILEIEKNLPVEVYNQLKSLSADNRLVFSDNTEESMPDASRVVVMATNDTVRAVEKFYPDFKFLFGPVINA
jgi:hypothetical protein